MKKVIMFISLITVAVIGFRINISADTTNIGVEVINDSIDYTNNTYVSPIDYNDFDTLYTDALSTNRIYWITSTNRPKITIDTTNTELRNTYKGIYVRIYDNDIADVVDYYFSFESILYDSRYINNEEIVILLDYGNIDEISIFINSYTLIYPMNTSNDNDYGVSVSLHRKISTDEYKLGYDKGLSDGRDNGLIEGQVQGYAKGLADGKEIGEDIGYQIGFDEGTALDTDVRPMFQTLITFIGSVFMLTIFPGVTIGVLVSIPISFALFKWFMKMFGGK